LGKLASVAGTRHQINRGNVGETTTCKAAGSTSTSAAAAAAAAAASPVIITIAPTEVKEKKVRLRELKHIHLHLIPPSHPSFRFHDIYAIPGNGLIATFALGGTLAVCTAIVICLTLGGTTWQIRPSFVTPKEFLHVHFHHLFLTHFGQS
jgi:hypothetical protein